MTSFGAIYDMPVYLNLFIESMGVDLAFLNASLKEDVSIDPPAGYPFFAKCLMLKLHKV